VPTNGRPKFTVRVDEELTDAFIAACPPKDEGGAAQVIRDFMAWYTWQKGARAPKRPPKRPAHDALSTDDSPS
jgi:hypothetical protein